MKNILYLLAALVLLSCQKDSSELKTKFSLPKKLKEVSGITYDAQNKLLWTLEDSGNANAIYALTSEGKMLQKLPVENAKNVDWEDITQDQNGNIYIGDFGNNDNTRTDLCIYKIDKNELNKEKATSVYKISFSYADQTEFPPKKTKMVYDVEGFFEFQNYFYLFTKNRSKNFDGTSLVYKITNKAGHQKAKLMGSFKTCSNYNHCAITSAAISPNQKKVALLCHDKIILFQDFIQDSFLDGNRKDIDLKHFSQKEAIVFKDNQTVLIADEKTNKIGGKVYEFSLK
ncbi:SdiA-regulated domain-containing protein [Flavobacterium agrisoli]|uniref:SdiA-regulated domain-containing protein n=1 Tax=Flavobacterium agrisoli TaxID=2793066 RepID=A0A934UJ83_9FLAO|nr:SdiA-regulated domain-containing protein [Flavobacterium agrisoli]MBK0369213.1 SdiA-regulated domain-containing protein [Flavobacterium agrisoli]